MLTPEQQDFLRRAAAQAEASGHPFPHHAACEAALESRYGTSRLAVAANNLFGLKEPKTPPPGWSYPTVELDTEEEENGVMVAAPRELWPVFPDWATSFRERKGILLRLQAIIPHYRAALAAADGETFVRLMSPCAEPPVYVAPEPGCRFTGQRCVTWATKLSRGNDVMALYREFFGTPAS